MWTFLKGIFSTKQPTAGNYDTSMKKFLIVGLGNIGSEYENTRHNIGFKVVDFLAASQNTQFETARLGAVAQYSIKGRNVILLKPSTYMNLSGKAVKYWLDKEKIPLENFMAVTDDLNLPFGTFRIKTKGSDGGHNGLKDIQTQLNTTQYNRFRWGISNQFNPGSQVQYVLGEWSEEEEQKLPERLKTASQAINTFVLAGITQAMNSYNGK